MKYSIKTLARHIIRSKPFTVLLVLTMLVTLSAITNIGNASNVGDQEFISGSNRP